MMTSDDLGTATIKRFAAFVSSERDRFANAHNNAFAFGFMDIGIYRGFLGTISARHQEAASALQANTEAMLRGAPSGPRPLTEEEAARFQDGHTLGAMLRLETESWYLFAKILLDEIARCLEFYFGPSARLSLDSHDQLVKNIDRYCQTKELVLPDRFMHLAVELKKDVADFRDYQIAHHKSPRTLRPYIFPEGKPETARIMHVQFMPKASDRQVESRSIPGLNVLIDSYLNCVLDLLEGNREKTNLTLESPRS
jgi:hypothetical protein